MRLLTPERHLVHQFSISKIAIDTIASNFAIFIRNHKKMNSKKITRIDFVIQDSFVSDFITLLLDDSTSSVENIWLKILLLWRKIVIEHEIWFVDLKRKDTFNGKQQRLGFYFKPSFIMEHTFLMRWFILTNLFNFCLYFQLYPRTMNFTWVTFCAEVF